MPAETGANYSHVRLNFVSQQRTAPALISVPPTIQALLAARLDRLSDPERRTIERASVVGKEFGQRDVSELTPADGRAAVAGS